MNETLRKIYYDPSSPGSLGSDIRLYNEAKKSLPTLTLEKVKEFLSGELTYTLHRSLRRNFKRNRMVASYENEHWQADLVDMSAFAAQNDGYNFILTIIDVFSKKAQAIPIKQKNSASMVKAFRHAFRNGHPQILYTDKGTEFLNRPLQDYFKKIQTIHYTSRPTSKVKAAVVERFNRTVKSRMFRYFTSRGHRKYLDILPELMKNYNNSFHRSIGMAPNNVNLENRQLVYNKLFPEGKPKKTRVSNTFKPNETVRIPHKFNPMDKGYFPNWHDKVYTVESENNNRGHRMFNVKDELGNIDKNSFYKDELQPVSNPIYRIERVLKTSGNRAFVKWLNHDNRFNSWIPLSEIQQL